MAPSHLLPCKWNERNREHAFNRRVVVVSSSRHERAHHEQISVHEVTHEQVMTLLWWEKQQHQRVLANASADNVKDLSSGALYIVCRQHQTKPKSPMYNPVQKELLSAKKKQCLAADRVRSADIKRSIARRVRSAKEKAEPADEVRLLVAAGWTTA